MNETQAATELAGNAPVLVDALDYSLWTLVLVVATLAVLLRTSTWVVDWTLNYAGVERPSEGDDARDGRDESGEVVAPDEDPAGDTSTETDGGTTETTDEGRDAGDTGKAIGKAENVLVLSLMLLEAYTALGVIFAAKSIVRKSDMDQRDTSYYLTGTMANFTYSVVVGLLLHVALRGIVKANLFGSLVGLIS
ncbi:hypothetical protein [Halorussus caseinilyticus]|uniref:DUF350 domain-containing protein n=1 Tax=Halorussus caseinilyticus TaxID=3034025 RepID=A0ABD5WQL2_9EURY|nr:hypothetical protein [Halorussus sp. DT72]